MYTGVTAFESVKTTEYPDSLNETESAAVDPNDLFETETLTEQVKLITTPEQDARFLEFAKRYAAACDYVSKQAFVLGITKSSQKMHKLWYYDIRDRFDLKSQAACSVFRTVAARYKTVDTQLKEQQWKFTDPGSGKSFCFKKDIRWLQSPVAFRRPQADLVRKDDWSILKDGRILSVSTLTSREQVPFQTRKDSRLMNRRWTCGTAKLVFHETDRHWYLHISVTAAIKPVQISDITTVAGIDRGLINLATVRRGDTTEYFRGEEAARIRSRYDRTRASLQSKGTRGARSVLKRISGRENSWMSDMNHRISKALVSEPGTLLVFEDLSGVSFDSHNLESRTAGGRHDLRNWAFYQLETMTAYKAAMNGCIVIKVDPAYTSQRCPCCGLIRKDSRDHSNHVYHCPECGGTWNDDEVASINLQSLGYEYLNGIKNPKIKVS